MIKRGRGGRGKRGRKERWACVGGREADAGVGVGLEGGRVEGCVSSNHFLLLLLFLFDIFYPFIQL